MRVTNNDFPWRVMEVRSFRHGHHGQPLIHVVPAGRTFWSTTGSDAIELPKALSSASHPGLPRDQLSGRFLLVRCLMYAYLVLVTLHLTQGAINFYLPPSGIILREVSTSDSWLLWVIASLPGLVTSTRSTPRESQRGRVNILQSSHRRNSKRCTSYIFFLICASKRISPEFSLSPNFPFQSFHSSPLCNWPWVLAKLLHGLLRKPSVKHHNGPLHQHRSGLLLACRRRNRFFRPVVRLSFRARRNQIPNGWDVDDGSKSKIVRGWGNSSVVLIGSQSYWYLIGHCRRNGINNRSGKTQKSRKTSPRLRQGTLGPAQASHCGGGQLVEVH